MKLITWNVQWCRGVDGKVDPRRIVQHAKAIADFDVLCLQEIANNFPDPLLAGSRGENQFAELSKHLPGYQSVPGAVIDVPDGKNARRRSSMRGRPPIPASRIRRRSRSTKRKRRMNRSCIAISSSSPSILQSA